MSTLSGTADWRPLQGMTIVDLTRMLPGGTATLLLADLGATVIKVEHPIGGDDTRRIKPSVGEDSSAQHQYMDRGKQVVRADLKVEAGRGIVYDLVRSADAVIESFRPGVAERLRVGFAQLVEQKPNLVYVSLTGYGQSGPRALAAGHDLNFVGFAGLVRNELPPVLQADVTGGMLAALAIVSGVLQARASGKPAHVDLALADAALVLGGMQIAEELAAYTLNEPVETPLNGTAPCYGIYRCADGEAIVVAAVEAKFWANVTQLVGRPEWRQRQNDPTLIPELQTLFASEPQAHWVQLLSGTETCVSPVLSRLDITADRHVTARGSLRQYTSVAGPLWQVTPPFRDITDPSISPVNTNRRNSHA